MPSIWPEFDFYDDFIKRLLIRPNCEHFNDLLGEAGRMHYPPRFKIAFQSKADHPGVFIWLHFTLTP